jgi:hypothetical protein
MTTAVVINVVLAALVFIAVIGLIGRTIHISSTLPEHRLGRLRTPREHGAARRRPAYRSLSTQA